MSRGGSYSFGYLEDADDIEGNLGLMRAAFGEQENVDKIVKRLIEHHPHMTLRDHFTFKHRGIIVASLNLIPQTWSLGGVPLKVAEMGCVATHPAHRHRGLQRMLTEEFHERLTEDGYDLSVIEGIPYFYRQFGYEYAIPLDEEATLGLDQIPDYESEHRVRPFTYDDIPRAARLLSDSQGRFLVHSVRDEKIWRMQQETGYMGDWRFDGYFVEDSGDPAAYFRLGQKGGQIVLLEVSEATPSTTRAILGFIKDLGGKMGRDSLLSRLSLRDPFTAFIIGLGAEVTRHYAWQVQVVDHEALFTKLLPLFNQRLEASPCGHRTETLEFNFYKFTIRMRLRNGSIEDISKEGEGKGAKIRINPYVFPQLLLGHRSREELQSWFPDVLISQSHWQIIDALFPKGTSYIHSCY